VVSESSWTVIVVTASVKENERREQGHTSNENRKRYSTALKEMTSTVLLKRGENNGIGVYVPKETFEEDGSKD
jgi:hypothetical protein